MAWMSFSASAALFRHPARYASSLLYINVAFHVFFTSHFQISRFSLQIEQLLQPQPNILPPRIDISLVASLLGFGLLYQFPISKHV
jgi:hypothetical protein